MKRVKGKYILIFMLVVLLVGALWLGLRLHEARVRHQEEEARLEAIREAEELEIIHTYIRLHYSLMGADDPDTLGELSEYYSRPRLYERAGRYVGPLSVNDHGIDWRVYLILRMYYHRAGIYLAHDKLIDYFSEEFEPDGSLRLYNNGLHPEIEAFVTWMWEGRRKEEFEAYRLRIDTIFSNYVSEHRDRGFNIPRRDITPQMYDALARAEADPDYVLDLTSLQEQGY
ncbi:MAG: hypothetical protein FWG67_00470 [Defluviitaleaceae bacterium]|nr:hypothetical protein [Defluviitaleaceae bacterium]